jgi:DNA-binding response OmpR family regulator
MGKAAAARSADSVPAKDEFFAGLPQQPRVLPGRSGESRRGMISGPGARVEMVRGQGDMRILLVEGDGPESESLNRALTRHGYEVCGVGAGREALTGHQQADLVLLALELPDLDGVQVCRGIRAASDVPLIALTAGTTELDRVLSLQAGADDCLVKPFGFRELLARMESVMRRARPQPPTLDEIDHGPLRIDPHSRQVRVRDQVVDVTRKEFDLLLLLASRPGAVVSRKELMAQVWQDDWAVSNRTIDTHVSTLRTKLGDKSLIVTVRGVGYRLGYGRDGGYPRDRNR